MVMAFNRWKMPEKGQSRRERTKDKNQKKGREEEIATGWRTRLWVPLIAIFQRFPRRDNSSLIVAAAQETGQRGSNCGINL